MQYSITWLASFSSEANTWLPTSNPSLELVKIQWVADIWFIIAETLGIHFSIDLSQVNFVRKDPSETRFFFFWHGKVDKIYYKEFSQEFWTKIYMNTIELYWASVDPNVYHLCELLESETQVQCEGWGATWLCLMCNPSTCGLGRYIEETYDQGDALSKCYLQRWAMIYKNFETPSNVLFCTGI